VIYLASISRELLCQQNEALANAVNVDSFAPAVQIAHELGIKRFIYASSVAVYGSSDKPLSEDAPLEPTTIYGRGKKACEDMMLASKSQMCKVVTRSASVCGYSMRQRFDLTINRMVHDACRRGVITVEGGEQIRSHVHINDLCDFYRLLLKVDRKLIDGQAFNVVKENQRVIDSAEMVSRVTGAGIRRIPRVDDRSYAVDGVKANTVLGFSPQREIEQAVRYLEARLDAGYWPDSMTNPVYQNMADVPA
jgi:nucleoside-diphosphate-sugar epimerase